MTSRVVGIPEQDYLDLQTEQYPTQEVFPLLRAEMTASSLGEHTFQTIPSPEMTSHEASTEWGSDSCSNLSETSFPSHLSHLYKAIKTFFCITPTSYTLPTLHFREHNLRRLFVRTHLKPMKLTKDSQSYKLQRLKLKYIVENP